MRKTRIREAIKTMKKVKEMNLAFNMSYWQDIGYDTNYESIKEFDKAISCGTACCMAGWIALTEPFKKAGGTVSTDGVSPCFNNVEGYNAIAEYFKIDLLLAKKLTAYFTTEMYDDVDHHDITVDMVIEKLEGILEGRYV